MIEHASGLDGFTEGVRWVELQHKLRSDTSWVVFTPDLSASPKRAKEEGGHILLQGHPGAVYLDVGPGLDRKEQVVGSIQFHDACIGAFSTARTVDHCIDAIKTVFEQWVWDGQQLPLPVDKRLYTQKENGTPIYQRLSQFRTDQINRYNRMQTGAGGFESVRKDVHAISI